MEAAVSIPVFLTFVLMFVMLIRIVTIEAALQSAANDTVKQYAAVWVPFEQPLQQAGGVMDQLDPSQWSFIPEPIKPFLTSLSGWSELPDRALQQLLSEALLPVVWQQIPDSWHNRVLRKERLAVEQVSIPYLTDTQGHFGLTLGYRISVKLPFYQKEIVIRKSAHERVWFGQ